MPPDGCGGDPTAGAGTPAGTAARTPEDARPLPGQPQGSTTEQLSVVTDPLWPLVATLGEIARRVSQSIRAERTDTA